jgi:cytochrome c-type biogenesis protein CcmH
MNSAFLLFAPAAILAAGAAWWIARAFVRGGPGAKPAPVLIGAGAGMIAALVLYLALGRPNLPDAPFAPRLAALEARAQSAPTSLSADELLAVLDARAKANPADPRPRLFAAEILATLGKDPEAAREYQAALKRAPDSPAALIGLGRVAVRLDQGVVSPASLALFQRAAALAPNDPAPWLYQALGASQDGRYAEAAKLWPEVLARLPAGDPRRAMVQQMIQQARAKTPQPPR